jgi:antitoxin PrlF
MTHFETALTSKGQITVPVEIRRLWNVKMGEKIEFFYDHRGEVCVRPFNAGAIDFLNIVAPKKRSPEFSTDEDALADIVLSRNMPVGKMHIAL